MLKLFLLLARPNKKQLKDIDFLLALGEIFTLVVYGQLIFENGLIYKIEKDIMEQIFDFMVRDFSKFALNLYSKSSSTSMQKWFCMKMIKKPETNEDLFNRVWNNHVYNLKDQYEMNK